MLKITLIALTLVLFASFATACGGQDDPPNCTSTTGCTDVDAGSDVDADDDATAPDANTPDGNTADACADYAGVLSDGWQCTLNGGIAIDMNGLTFIAEDGACHLSSDSFWCQNAPPATDVQAGNFSCTDINGDFDSCWHN